MRFLYTGALCAARPFTYQFKQEPSSPNVSHNTAGGAIEFVIDLHAVAEEF